MADVPGQQGSAVVNVSEALKALQAQFLTRLPGRLDDVQRMWAELGSGQWSQLQAEALHRAVHSLTGTSGTFGLKALSKAARQFESRLHTSIERGRAPSDDEWASLKLAHEALRTAPREVPDVGASEAVKISGGQSSTEPGGLVSVASERWRVLLVDDDEEVLELHADILRQAGMEVWPLARASEAVEAVRQFEPDVVLLDVYMPDASGPQIAAALREMEDWLHLAILFLSGETDLTQQLLALDLGGDDFLIKPVQPAHLVAAVNARARRARHSLGVQRRLQTTLYEREREHLALDHHAIVCITDPVGHLTYVNDRFCEVSGYPRDELLGRHLRLLISGEHPAAFFEHLRQEVNAGRVWQGEISSRRKDGSLIWLSSTVTPFMDSVGKPYQFVTIHTDITHIKEAQATLKRQRDLQRVIGEAAAGMVAAEASALMPTIQEALKASAEQLNADRGYLILFSRDGKRVNRLVGWDAPSQAPLKMGVLNQVFPSQGNAKPWLEQDASWLTLQFLSLNTLLIPDAKLLKQGAAADVAFLMDMGLRALIAVPLTVQGRLVGLLGYGCAQARPDWRESEGEALKMLSEVIGSALARRRVERALRESESRLHFLVASSPVTIYTCSARPPHALTYVSPNVTRLTGFEPGRVLGQRRFWLSHVHPEDRRRVVEELPKLWVDDSHQQEYRLRTCDGNYLWVHDQLRLVRDSAGEPQEIIGYWMDITARKSYEDALAQFNDLLEHQVQLQTRSVIESERMARATLDALSARVVILDHNGVILAANRAWAVFRQEQAGFERVAEGQNYLELCDRLCDTATAAGKPIATGIRRLMAGEIVEFFHEYAVAGAVDSRWFVCRVDRFPGQGDVRVVVSHEDITLMKLSERQQMRSQRLESLGTLAGGVAHDLNNALAPILMGMEVLKEDYPGEIGVLDMIQGSARRGADMVRQLLAFAKGADGERVVLDAVRLVREVESMMRGSFPKNIQVVVNCDPLLPGVLGDSTQLHQVLLNLCLNARDALPHGGALNVSADWVDVDASFVKGVPEARVGRYVRLQVSDSGIGIAPEILDRIFDPFFTTKSLDKGTGLGLSTVVGIVKGHKGFLQVHSKEGEGSKFSIYLPAHEMADVAAIEPVLQASFVGGGEQVLFVDDESAVRDMGQAVLTRLRLDPILATDGADGLVKAMHHQHSLRAVITDMHMPFMDGLTFARSLRRSLPDIPIVVCSGRLDDAVAAEFLSLGGVARLDKPFTEAQLAAALQAVLLPA